MPCSNQDSNSSERLLGLGSVPTETEQSLTSSLNTTVELGYDVMKGVCVVINECFLTELYNVVFNGEELIRTTEWRTL